MSKLDDLIEQSLTDEDRDLLAHYGQEPGYLRQVQTLFGGRLGWVMWLVMISALIAFGVSVYALYQLFTTSEALQAVRWGVVAVILMQLTTFLRGFMGTHLQANRTLRELKRLELRMVQLKSSDALIRVVASRDGVLSVLACLLLACERHPARC